jgi:hypothetical protein
MRAFGFHSGWEATKKRQVVKFWSSSPSSHLVRTTASSSGSFRATPGGRTGLLDLAGVVREPPFRAVEVSVAAVNR